EASLADLDPRLRCERQPASRLDQRVVPDHQPALVQRFQDLALDRESDEGAGAGHVAVDPPAPSQAPVALVPTPLHPPQPPAGFLSASHRRNYDHHVARTRRQFSHVIAATSSAANPAASSAATSRGNPDASPSSAGTVAPSKSDPSATCSTPIRSAT